MRGLEAFCGCRLTASLDDLVLGWARCVGVRDISFALGDGGARARWLLGVSGATLVRGETCVGLGGVLRSAKVRTAMFGWGTYVELECVGPGAWDEHGQVRMSRVSLRFPVFPYTTYRTNVTHVAGLGSLFPLALCMISRNQPTRLST